jgi:bifunctional DNA-binding transcriptional regulator/antitoxin component of YhaV-PrlF toxin-antitoxin module
MHIVSVLKVGHSLCITIPHRIHRAWRLQRGARVIVEQTETGRATFRPLEVKDYDPVAGRERRARRNR